MQNINNRCQTLNSKEKFTTNRCYKTCIVVPYVVVNALSENKISKEERKNPKKKTNINKIETIHKQEHKHNYLWHLNIEATSMNKLKDKHNKYL